MKDKIDFVDKLLSTLHTDYYQKLFNLAKQGLVDLKTFPGFLLKPDKVVVHLGDTHVGVEYYGSEVLEALPTVFETEREFLDHRGSKRTLMESIIGFSIEGNLRMPMDPPLINAVIPTHAGSEAMQNVGWNFTAQEMFLIFNGGPPKPTPGKFGRIVNGFFFDGNGTGLISRHIKWLDVFPSTVEDINENHEDVRIDISIVPNLVQADQNFIYPLPSRSDFRNFRLPLINRFVEAFGNPTTSEVEITAFLNRTDHRFILTTRFGGIRVASQIRCEWQSVMRDPIIPDFFIVKADGYADIVEFKLPEIGTRSVVGRTNRRRLSAQISEYVAQTRVYREYFEDPNNRRWFEDRYGFKVHHPKRYLVMGRRFDFNEIDWRNICFEYRDLEIVTFDDIVDTVTAQFYT